MNWIEELKAYAPYNEQEEKDKEIILKCIDTFEEVLTRKNELAHMTSSAFVINKNRDKMLMVYHNIYDSWSWVGGHADGDSNLCAVALKEAKEETGIQNINSASPEIFAIDVLPVSSHVKKGAFVASHLHLSLTYLFIAEEEDALTIKEDENSGVMWIPFDKIKKYSTEPHMIKVYEKLIRRLEC